MKKSKLYDELQEVLSRYIYWEEWFNTNYCPLTSTQKETIKVYLNQRKLQQLLSFPEFTEEAQILLLQLDMNALIAGQQKSIKAVITGCRRALEILKKSSGQYSQFRFLLFQQLYAENNLLLEKAKLHIVKNHLEIRRRKEKQKRQSLKKN